MLDRATPNLPSRDLVAASQFYARLGFTEAFRDEGWLIVERPDSNRVLPVLQARSAEEHCELLHPRLRS